MKHGFQACTDPSQESGSVDAHSDTRDRNDLWRLSLVWRTIPTILFVIWLFGPGTMRPAHADSLGQASDAYSRGDYVRSIRVLSPLALRGNARAQALLGFMYENGFGVPQSYDTAADLYQRAAVHGDPFAQSRLGLIYDKGHGVPQNVVLSYKWHQAAQKSTSSGMSLFFACLSNRAALSSAAGRPS
jgi:uncharacterized protein